MSKAYPRRRDVRERLLLLFEILYNHYDPAEGDFDTEFLTSIRDYMREGADLETSIQVSAEGYKPSTDEVSEEELAAFIDSLRSAALASAGVPEEDEWDPPPQDDGEEGSDYNYDY